MSLAKELERGEKDAEEVLRADVHTEDELGALHFEVVAWTRRLAQESTWVGSMAATGAAPDLALAQRRMKEGT